MRELQIVWFGCGFDRSSSRDAVNHFLTDIEYIVDWLAELATRRDPLDSSFPSIRPTSMLCCPILTHRTTIRPLGSTTTARLYGHLDWRKVRITAEFIQSKQVSQEAAMRGASDALAVDQPIWILGDSTDNRQYMIVRSLSIRLDGPATPALARYFRTTYTP